MADYSSDQIQVLTFPEAIRKRPGMYFGEISSMAVNTIVYEAIANAIDQYLLGNSTRLSVQINNELITISDDGKGLPFDRPSIDDNCEHLAESYFLNRHIKATADGHAPHVHTMNSGIGLVLVNAASESLIVRSCNGSQQYHQKFSKGNVLERSNIEDASGATAGTTLIIKPDAELFQGHGPHLSELRKTLFEVAHFYPGLIVEFQQERFLSTRGLIDLAYLWYSKPPAAWVNGSPKEYTFECFKEGVQVRIAALGESNEMECKSWVNGIETLGGSHVEGAKKAFFGVKPKLVLVHVIMHDPRYAGPCRDELVCPKVEDIIVGLVKKGIS